MCLTEGFERIKPKKDLPRVLRLYIFNNSSLLVIRKNVDQPNTIDLEHA